MSNKSNLDEVLDAVEHLSPDQQSYLVEVVRRRLAERGRQQVEADVREARAEFSAGGAALTEVGDLLKEIGS